MLELGEGLDHEQVDPALEEALDLFAEGLANDPFAIPRWAMCRAAERSDRTTDEDLAPAHVAGLSGQLCSAAVEHSRLGGQPVAGQSDSVRAKGGRLDRVRARFEIFAVDRADQVRSCDHELVEARALGNAAAEQQGAHGAVEQQRAACQPLVEAAPFA